MKYFLSLVFLSLLSFNAIPLPDFYGHLNLSADYYFGESSQIKSDLKSNASRLGVRGDFRINDNITGIYQAEYQVDLEASPTTRNTFLGFKGSFGTIKAGKHDTPLKLAQLDADLFNDTQGDIANITRGENRPSSYLGYDSPEIAKGLTLSLGLSKSNYIRNNFIACTSSNPFVGNACLKSEYKYGNHIAGALKHSVPVIFPSTYLFASPISNSASAGLIPSIGTTHAEIYSCNPPSAEFLESINTGLGSVTGGIMINPNLAAITCNRSFGRNISFSLNYSTDVIRFAIASQKNGEDGFDHNRLGMMIPAGPSTIGFIYTSSSSSKSTYTQGGQFFDYEAFTASIKTELIDGKGILKMQYDRSNAIDDLEQTQIGYDHNLTNSFKVFTNLTHRSNISTYHSFLSVGIEYKFNHSFSKQ
jgi:predicted porin